ncbi:ROK family protein [Pedobacter sp. MC2016-05]|uniref:ROK family protein n=1 Tax=Pedobacter sp. MC2016-05 TaxID=2994474 RepID=UPI002247BBDD|nr:ROK family protein [Pedobacter sp. MC2016-05]MCX2477016.1 ROK family protein [Pedobacter sp. MC2016-05]
MEESILHAIGIRIDNNLIRYGVVSQNGEILYKSEVSLKKAKSHTEIIGLLIDAINECAHQYRHSILGVGLGFPGIVENNVIVGGGINLPGFRNIELGNVLRLVTRLNITIDNDANLMALGEKTYGNLDDISDAVFLDIGSGIGGAVMINSKIFPGFKNRGVELGHIIVEHKGEVCGCGARGCLEVYASVGAMKKKYLSQSADKSKDVDFLYLLDKYRSGDPAAFRVVECHFEYMATGIVSLINIFNPQRIVIGGEVKLAGTYYIKEIERRLIAIAVPPDADSARVISGTLGIDACILGGAASVFNKFQQSPIRKKCH